jgi:hypothetical protein
MNIIESITEFFKKSREETLGTTPIGLCPNCWGTQEYDTTIRELYKDHQIDINNHKDHYAFIQKFVVDKIQGIQIKKGDSAGSCPTCVAKM